MPLSSKDFGWLDNYYIWDAITSAAITGISQDELWEVFNGWSPPGQDPAIALFESQSGVFTSLANLLYSNNNSAAQWLEQIETDAANINNTIQSYRGQDNTAAPTHNVVIAGVQANGTCQTIEVNASGHVNIADGGGSITIDGAVTNTPLPTTPCSGYTAAITNTTATDVILAGGAGVFTYITQVLVTNSHASVGTLVSLRDDTGTIFYSGYAAPAGGGFTLSFPTPLKMPASNKKLQAVCGTTGSNVYVSANGFYL